MREKFHIRFACANGNRMVRRKDKLGCEDIEFQKGFGSYDRTLRDGQEIETDVWIWIQRG